MPNPTASDVANLIDRCEQIALRYINHNVRQNNLLELAMKIKYDTTWRLILHSATGAKDFWDQLRLEPSKGWEDMVVGMTNEFYLRSAEIFSDGNDSFYATLGKSLAWPKLSDVVDDETKKFTSESDKYKQVFKNNPWVLFLYLLSMSDIVRKILTLQVIQVDEEEGK